jgi:hypothetical protein
MLIKFPTWMRSCPSCHLRPELLIRMHNATPRFRASVVPVGGASPCDTDGRDGCAIGVNREDLVVEVLARNASSEVVELESLLVRTGAATADDFGGKSRKLEMQTFLYALCDPPAFTFLLCLLELCAMRGQDGWVAERGASGAKFVKLENAYRTVCICEGVDFWS